LDAARTATVARRTAHPVSPPPRAEGTTAGQKAVPGADVIDHCNQPAGRAATRPAPFRHARLVRRAAESIHDRSCAPRSQPRPRSWTRSSDPSNPVQAPQVRPGDEATAAGGWHTGSADKRAL